MLKAVVKARVELCVYQISFYDPLYTPCRWSSDRPGFFTKFVQNVKQEFAKNKEMQESLKKFREEAQKLEQSEALKKARMKFQAVESEASKSGQVLKEKFDTIKHVFEEAGKTKIAQKAGQIGAEIGKSAKGAAETLSEKGHQLGQTTAFRTISHTASAVKNELDEGHHVYQPPVKLRKRVETVHDLNIKADTTSLGIEVHKDSKFSQSWQRFKENNPYLNKVLDWKMKYDESDNVIIRASRALTEKVSDVMSGIFQKTELSETLTELCKMDENFDKNAFLKDCEKDFIPNILEAIVRGDLDILKDWCHQGAYNVLSTPIKQAKNLNYIMCSKILDIDRVDLVMGKMMEQGPVLVITFTSQQILCIRNREGIVVEGDPNKVLRVNYVWVLCRDPTELNPKAAWRLLDLTASSYEQLL